MGRHRTPQEKLRIINEVRHGGQPISNVCRRHGISPARFYEWEKRLKEGGVCSAIGACSGRNAMVEIEIGGDTGEFNLGEAIGGGAGGACSDAILNAFYP